MAINDQIFVIREAIVKLTQMLAGKGIQVTQRGVSAYVRADDKGRPFLVNLPYIPDNATQELIDAIQGFLDHEVAHILFTEFNQMEKAQRVGAGGMLNLIEDSRIEREMANRFKGSAENMARMGKFFLDKYTTPKMKEALASGDTDALVGVLMVPLVRAMAGQQVFKEFMDDKMPHMQEVYDKIKDLAPKIAAASSTKDCLELAKTITKRLRDGGADDEEDDPSGAPPMKMPGSGGGGKGKPSPGKKGGGKKDEDDEEEKDEEEGSGSAGDEDEEEGESGGDDDKDSGDSGDAGDGDMATGGGSDDEGEGGESSGKASAPPGGEVDISQSSSINWEAIDKETAVDYDEIASSMITNSAAEAAAHADYLVYSTDGDVIEPLHVGKAYNDAMLTSLEDKVNHMVAPLQKDLERAISARSLSSWSPGHRSGRLNAAALSRLAVQDTRVFRRKHEVTSKDVAVELVVDMSGSMHGTKIHTAAQAAYALAAVLERIGIPCEVICFTTGHGWAGDMATMAAEEAKIGRKYSRSETLYMPVLKGFTERMTTDVKKRFGWLPNCMDLRNNVDGECVEIAGRRLMARREKGKVMMVLSDGAPHAYGNVRTLGPHLKKVVDNLSKAGVNVVGIGIESSEVKRFYPKSLVLNNVAELPTIVMKELRSLIVH